MKTFKITWICFLLASLIPRTGRSQGTGSIFSQGSSKIKLMVMQIIGYQNYLLEIKTGYHLMEDGLNTVKDLKGGTYSLYTAYFNSLQQVSPAVKNSPKAKAIADLQQQIITLFTNELAWQQRQQILNASEIADIRAVYQNLLAKSRSDMAELNDIITPGKMQMSDHQRLERIDHVYTAMQDKQAFASSFTSYCRQLATDRKKARSESDQLKKLYGIG